jgi:hypothetical protein
MKRTIRRLLLMGKNGNKGEGAKRKTQQEDQRHEIEVPSRYLAAILPSSRYLPSGHVDFSIYHML